MLNNKSFQELLHKEVNRKQFLQLLGSGILGIIGVTAFLNNIDKFARVHTKRPVAPEVAQQRYQQGYGSSPYGR